MKLFAVLLCCSGGIVFLLSAINASLILSDKLITRPHIGSIMIARGCAESDEFTREVMRNIAIRLNEANLSRVSSGYCYAYRSLRQMSDSVSVKLMV